MLSKLIEKLKKGNLLESILDNLEENIKYGGDQFKERHRQIIAQKRRIQYCKKLKREIFDQVVAECKFSDNLEHERSNIIWFCWLQGIENAPLVIQSCYQSIKEQLCKGNKWKLVVITEKNIVDYVRFPEFIMKKYDSGIITRTHFSDLLRIELLIQYGGLWIDSTVFLTGNRFFDVIKQSDLFAPSKWVFFNGEIMTHDSWIIYSISHNEFLMVIRECLYSYWEKYDFQIDYFLLHLFWTLTVSYYGDKISSMPYLNVHACEYLSHILFQKVDKCVLESILIQTDIHKLSYKYNNVRDTDMKDTYYTWVLENNLRGEI